MTSITYLAPDGTPLMCVYHPERMAVHSESVNLSLNSASSVPSTFGPNYGYCDECAPAKETLFIMRHALKPKRD